MAEEESKGTGEFSVCQFFEDDTYMYVRRFVSVEEAMHAVGHYTNSVGARLGFVKRVIVTDGMDFTAMEWKFGEGFTFPPEAVGKTMGRPSK